MTPPYVEQLLSKLTAELDAIEEKRRDLRERKFELERIITAYEEMAIANSSPTPTIRFT